MTTGLFEKLFTYRQLTDERTPLENFTTEVFAHCLKVDKNFAKNFFNFLGIEKSGSTIDVNTQIIYKNGISDIQIEFDDRQLACQRLVFNQRCIEASNPKHITPQSLKTNKAFTFSKTCLNLF